MTAVRNIWQRASELTRYLILFAVINGAVLNLPILLFTPDTTVFHYTRAFFEREAYNDSWAPMRQALQYLHEPGLRKLFSDKPLYTVLFFDQNVKFQYPATSLLLLEPLREISRDGFIRDDLLNSVSWAGIVLMGFMLWRILLRGAGGRKSGTDATRGERLLLLFLCLTFTLIFYPLLKAFVLGQVQTWIDILFAGLMLSWITNRRKLSGFLAGIICIIKPQLIVLLIWGALRKQRKFVLSLLITVAAFVSLSVAVYGLENNLGYFSVVSFIAQHGESYFPNQSVNGLLNRILFNGNNIEWVAREFPPFNQIVFWGTLLSSFLILGFAFFRKRNGKLSAGPIDLSIIVLSATIASPIAWEHHYGILLPIFAFILPAAIEKKSGKKTGIIFLSAAYILTGNYFQFINATAPTYFNFLQSYIFFGAVLLLVYLYSIRGLSEGD